MSYVIDIVLLFWIVFLIWRQQDLIADVKHMKRMAHLDAEWMLKADSVLATHSNLLRDLSTKPRRPE